MRNGRLLDSRADKYSAEKKETRKIPVDKKAFHKVRKLLETSVFPKLSSHYRLGWQRINFMDIFQ
jgi:hypothetical protein